MAKIVVVGSGVFGTLAAEELRARGHDATNVSRRTGVNMRDVPGMMRALEKADAVLHAAGPFQQQESTVARAAAAVCIPYVDISDDRPFSESVHTLDATSPLLTGMSTTPAVADAFIALARGDDRDSSPACAMYVGGANKQGPATLEFAARSRAHGRSLVVDFPGIGRRRAFPARANVEGDYYVAVGGLAGLGWRFRPLVRHAARLGAVVPRLGNDTAGALVAFVGGRRQGIYALERGQRLAVLPAVWALEEALAGRAPARPALPREWVEPRNLVEFLVANGFTRWSA